MTDDLLGSDPPSRVRLLLLPWRPRWRSPDLDLDPSGLLDVLGAFDDPVSAVLAGLALLLVLPAVVAVLLGAALLSLEVLAVLPLGLLLLAGRLCRLQPWVLVARWPDGRRALVEVRGGLGAARCRRTALLGGAG